jgi:signal transduction histidine kinase
MKFSAWLKFAGPLIVISLLLLGLGVVAAWNVQRQQVLTSELVAREVASMLTEQDLYMNMREVRYRLNQYLRTHDHSVLDPVPTLCQDTVALLKETQDMARAADERAAVMEIAAGFDEFNGQYQEASKNGIDASDTEVLVELADHVLTQDVLDPVKGAIAVNRAVVERTNAANRHTTDLMRQGFLLLGLTGGASGLIIGLTLARTLHRTIVQLSVSVSGAADTLEKVVGPVNVSTSGGLADLREALRDMEQHISQVVERLRERELEVLRNEQLAVIGQLAAGLAHELRNPLMPMKMLVQSAIERGNDATLGGRQLSVLAEEIGRLETSIQNFLDFARPPAMEIHPVDLAALIRQSKELVEPRARQQNVEIQEQLPAVPCWFAGDAVHLRQVLLNLLLNALDELPQGGRITLAVKRDDEQKQWQIDVRDTGLGFHTGILSRVFEPFATTKETGTGLGLTICKRIVEAHQGSIAAANDAAGGAVFTIRLPLDNSLHADSPAAVLERNHEPCKPC